MSRTTVGSKRQAPATGVALSCLLATALQTMKNIKIIYLEVTKNAAHASLCISLHLGLYPFLVFPDSYIPALCS